MTLIADQVAYNIERIRALIPAGEDMKEYLRRALDLHLESLSDDTPMGIVPPSLLSATQMFASTRVAVELINRPAELAASPERAINLGLMEWLLRPALLIKNGSLERIVSGPWVELSEDVIEEHEKAVCRLDIAIDGYAPIHVGTGFIVGIDEDERNIIMTNAHVVEGAVRLGWPKAGKLIFGCDFGCYSVDSGNELIPLAKEYDVHPQYDLALLYIESREAEGHLPQNTLSLSAKAPVPTSELKIGVVGHPSFDSRLDTFPKYFGFGDQFGVKRFSPGFIRVLENRNWRGHDVSVVTHDATTLSGSSGSCIFDLTNMNIVGLHFGGWPMLKQYVQTGAGSMLAQLFHDNGAVPLWTLSGDPLLQKATFS